MKRLLLTSAVLMAVLALPSLAGATGITNLVGIADCDGFNAQVDVHFRSSAEYLDLHYRVAVLELDWEIVVVEGDLHVVQEDSQDVSIMVSDQFNTVLDGVFVVAGTITTTAPYPGGVDVDSAGFSNEIQCGSVDNTPSTFENIKSMYR